MGEWWRRWTFPIRLLSPHARQAAEDDLEAEVDAHLEMELQEQLDAGASPEQAWSAARRRLGNVTLYKEDVRETWGVSPFDRFWQDLRFGARMLAKKRLMTAVAVLSLGLGIGANTALFTALRAALYGAPPLYDNPGRLVTVWETAPREPGERLPASTPSYRAWTAEPDLFESLAAVQSDVAVSLQLEDYPVQVWAQRASANLMSTLGVRPLLGRGFLPSDEAEAAGRVVILDYGLWQSRFGADADIVGRSLTIDGVGREVVGVMPRGFWFGNGYTELWLPLCLDEGAPAGDDHRLQVLGRLDNEVSLEEARTRLASRAPHLEQLYPERQGGWGVRVDPVRTIDAMDGEVPPGFVQLFGTLGLVLLIACTNIASVMVARGSTRQRETAIRAALGAGRFRLIRQLLTESLLLAGLGGAAGLAFAYWGLALIVRFAPGDLAHSMDLGIDGAVLAFPLAITMLTGFASGLAPALADSRVDVNRMLKEGGDGRTTGQPRQRLRSALVVSEVALSLMLLVVVGLTIESFLVLKQMDPGFQAERLTTFSLELPEAEYLAAVVETPAAQGSAELSVEVSPRAGQLFERLSTRLEQLADVEAAAYAFTLPPRAGTLRSFSSGRLAASASDDAPVVSCNAVSSGLLQTLGAHLLRGRLVDRRDTTETPWVAVINQAMARRYWPDQDPLGQSVRLEPSVGERPRTIVGVVADLRNRGMSLHAAPEMYVPFAQQPARVEAKQGRARLETLFVLRLGSASEDLADRVRTALAEIDPGLAISDMAPMQARLDVAAQELLIAVFLNAPIIGLALALTAVGVYGVLSFSVSWRIREIGVRIALGAGRPSLLRLILLDGLRLTAVGVGLGALGALALRRIVAGLLLEVVSMDPLLLILAALAVMTIAGVASYVPARRATRVDPVIALRYE